MSPESSWSGVRLLSLFGTPFVAGWLELIFRTGYRHDNISGANLLFCGLLFVNPKACDQRLEDIDNGTLEGFLLSHSLLATDYVYQTNQYPPSWLHAGGHKPVCHVIKVMARVIVREQVHCKSAQYYMQPSHGFASSHIGCAQDVTLACEIL